MPPALIRTNSAVFNGLLLATAAALRDELDLDPELGYGLNNHQRDEAVARQEETEQDYDPPPIPIHLNYQDIR